MCHQSQSTWTWCVKIWCITILWSKHTALVIWCPGICMLRNRKAIMMISYKYIQVLWTAALTTPGYHSNYTVCVKWRLEINIHKIKTIMIWSIKLNILLFPRTLLYHQAWSKLALYHSRIKVWLHIKSWLLRVLITTFVLDASFYI